MTTSRAFSLVALLVLMTGLAFAQTKPAQTKAPAAQPAAQAAPVAAPAKAYTLVVHCEGVNNDGGNIGVLVFQNERGWPEERLIALKDVVVPAQQGTVTVTIPDLPAGDYAVSVAHDVNKNRKLDKNFLGKPKEQWGLSNNPHAVLKAPPFNKCKFTLNKDMELHITMQM